MTDEKIKEEIHSEIISRIVSELCLEAEILASRLLVVANPRSLVYIQFHKIIAKTQKDIDDSADYGDIHFFKSGEENYGVVEVKRLSKDNSYAYFQRPEDFRSGVIIDGVNQITKKKQLPQMYMTFNHPLTHFFTSYPTKDLSNWEKREINGKLFYIAHTTDCKFFSVKEFEKLYKQ